MDNQITEEILCPSCLSPNDKNAQYCIKCNTPIGNSATIDPVLSAISEGRGISDGVNKPSKFIIVFGVWFLFLPCVAAFLYFSIIGFIENYSNIGILMSILCGLISLLFGFIILKTTYMYLKNKKNTKNNL